MAKAKVSFTDLKAMFEMVREHIGSREFSWCPKEDKDLVMAKYKELENEIYERLYGRNPFGTAVNPAFRIKEEDK